MELDVPVVKVKKHLSSWKYYRLLLNSAIYLFLFILIAVIVAISPAFLSVRNFEYILMQASTRIIIALAAASILITGNVDLAAGRMTALSAIVAASVLQAVGYEARVYPHLEVLPLIVPLLLGIALCVGFSVAQGFVVARFKIDPLIASLGTGLIVYGTLSLYFDAVAGSAPIGGLDERYTRFAQGAIQIGPFTIFYLIIYAAIITAAVWFIWSKTAFGKNMYAIGGNRVAATVSGVNIVKNLVGVYALAGILYGIAGFLEAGRTGSATNSLGTGYELDAISAAVLGGVSLTGGVGTIRGVLIGVLLFQVINYGLVFISVSPYLQYIIKGAIIILAVTIDTQKNIEKK
jgi:methyl-galactoside transport system permease protein